MCRHLACCVWSPRQAFSSFFLSFFLSLLTRVMAGLLSLLTWVEDIKKPSACLQDLSLLFPLLLLLKGKPEYMQKTSKQSDDVFFVFVYFLPSFF